MIKIFCNKYDVDAFPCKYGEDERCYYMKILAVGKTLSVREMNGYDDSDFYASYWDEESQSIKEIMYATTRFWTYPANAVIDATPDIIEKAKLWELKIKRNRKAKELRLERKILWKIKYVTNLPFSKCLKIKDLYQDKDVKKAVYILLSANLRSPFRKSLRDTFINWINAESPKYTSPFSKKQWGILLKEF